MDDEHTVSAVRLRCLAIMQEHFGRDAPISDTDKIMDDLGGDDLDFLEILMAFEEEFTIEISDEAWAEVENGPVGGMIALVEQLCKAKEAVNESV